MDETIQAIINNLSNNVFVIEQLMKDKETFDKNLETFYDFLKQGFEVKELRTCPVYFRFFDRQGEPIHTLQLRHFVTNMMFWQPIGRLGVVDKLDESYIVDCTKISSKLIKTYIDEKIIKPYRKLVNNRKMNKIIADMIFNLSRISTDFNIILGLSINVETFMDVAERNPRFNEIIHTKLPDDMQPNEIEATLDKLMHEEINILVNDPGDNFLKPILRSGTGIKDKQLSEFSINGGLKPDLDGNTIPIPINSNFIVGGLSNISNYYIDSLGGRKSVIMNKKVMGHSGHFARMVMLLVSSIKLRKDEKSCNTVHPILYEIKTKEHLKRLIGRYYRTMTSRTYQVLTGEEKHLIGQKIFVKSPATCASKNYICKECYGDLYHTNKDITIGAYAGTKITEPVSQNILSSKHLLTTKSEKIEFNEEFYKFFSLSANEVILNNLNDDIDLNDYSLVLLNSNIVTINEFDDTEYNKYVTIFHIKNKRTGEIVEIQENTLKELYLSPELIDLMNKEKNQKEIYEIDFSKIEDDCRIFVLEIENNELTKPLYSIMALLNRTDHEGCSTIDEMCQKMLDLLIESNIKATAVHGEVLINPLIRSVDDILERPNFAKYGESAEYQILTVEAALERHPSVLISLSFQALGRQLTNPLTFRKKETSFIDPFFKERP